MRAFLINLDRSPERLAFMSEQLDGLRIAYTRVPAIDGNFVDLTDSVVDQRAFYRRHHALLRRGEIGCYLSHLRALWTFLLSGADCGLILEDDAVLSPYVPSILEQLEQVDAWDIVKLHVTHPGGIISRLSLDPGHKLVSLAFRHGSAAAYVVNRIAAKRLLEGLLPMTVPYDHEFDRAWKYRLRLRAVLPLVVSRETFPSTITTSTPVAAEHRQQSQLRKPWYAQGGMVLFRGANDVARVLYELLAQQRIGNEHGRQQRHQRPPSDFPAAQVPFHGDVTARPTSGSTISRKARGSLR